MDSTSTPLNTQPQISEAMLWVASAFGMQDFETFSLLATRKNSIAFSVWLPDKEILELSFQLHFKEDNLYEYWIYIHTQPNKKTLHSWVYNSTADLDDIPEVFFSTLYGRHICGGFYSLGIDTDFIDFLGLFTAHEKLEMALQHRELMQKLTQLSLNYRPNL